MPRLVDGDREDRRQNENRGAFHSLFYDRAVMRFFIVDVFAERKYEGNPLAVFLLDRDVSPAEMQQIAREIHFSESTFITPGKRDGGFDVRIFTPDVEIPFAGHPTLGTAFVIRDLLRWEHSDRVTLNLGVGPILVDFDNGLLTMQQNAPHFGTVIDDRARIASILSIDAADIDDRFPVQLVSTGLPSVIVPLKTLDAIGRCRIRHDLYQQFLDDTTKAALLVFTPHHNDIRVRVFVDDTGFFEDPATGSANGNLAAWLVRHRYFGRDTIEYRAQQGVEMRRPSQLYVAASPTSIRVGGRVFRVAEGEWDG